MALSITAPTSHALTVGTPVEILPEISGAVIGENTWANNSQLWVTAAPVNSAMGAALPEGLTCDPQTGIISGTPLAPGTYQIKLRAVQYYSQAQVASLSRLAARPLVYPAHGDGAVFVDTLAVKLFRRSGLAQWVGLSENTTCKVDRSVAPESGFGFGLKTAGGAVVSNAWLPDVNDALIGNTSCEPAESATITLVVTGSALPPNLDGGAYDILWNWDLQTGVAATTVFPTASQETATPDLPPQLRPPLIFPAKVHDKQSWYFSLFFGSARDISVPTNLSVVVWDPESDAWIVLANAAPVQSLVGGLPYYGVSVQFTQAKFQHLVNRADGLPAKLLDAEIRATFSGGKTRASRTFQIWLEDSVDLTNQGYY